MGVLDLLGILKCFGEFPDEADIGESAERYAGVLGSTKFSGFALGGDIGGCTVTAGGSVDTGRGRIILEGEGDMFTELVRSGRNPLSDASSSLPRAARITSLKSPSSGRTESGLTISCEPLRMLLPVGCGEIALWVKALFGLDPAICSK